MIRIFVGVSVCRVFLPLFLVYPSSLGITCSIIYKDPDHRDVFKREVTHEAPRGKVSYLSKMNGEHEICVSCTSSQVFIQMIVLTFLVWVRRGRRGVGNLHDDK